MAKNLPKVQRVAAYGLVLRDGRILLTRLASRISADERWHLPGGGVDHGEDPRDALVREIREETGLAAEVGETAHVYSAHRPSMWRQGRRWDYQALRIVYDAWVPVDAPEPRVVEVDGSTVDVAWHPVADVLSGTLPVTDIVTEALADHRPFRLQRLAVYALVRRGGDVLLTRISARGAHPGAWTLPGGGLDHGESPARRGDPRGARGVRRRLRGGRSARRPRHPLRGDGALGPLRGLPRRAPGLPRQRPRPGASHAWSRPTAPPTPWLGAGRRCRERCGPGARRRDGRPRGRCALLD